MDLISASSTFVVNLKTKKDETVEVQVTLPENFPDKDLVGKKAKFKFLDMQPGDVQKTFADTHRLENWVDWNGIRWNPTH